MSVREYIGARYIPLFADPIEWDSSLIYEPLTVVQYQGGSYVSRREVPAGIELDNTDYWILWADFNAQLQHYIDVVNTFDGRIDDLEDALPISEFNSVDTIDARFDTIEADDWVTSDRIADDAVGTSAIADDAITSDKIADDAVGTSAIADDAITSAKIDDGAVGTSAIADDAITSAKIDDGAVGTSAIADDAITSAKIDDGAVGTSAIADDAITLNKIGFNLGDVASTELNVYVAGTNGNDANGGTSDSDAVKTLDRAFDIIEKSGKQNVAIRIREDGIYNTTKNEFSNMCLHITQGEVAHNSKIVFDGGLASFYNSYIHLGTYEQYTFELEFISGLHSDNCAWYVNNSILNIHTRGDFNYSKMSFPKATITTHVLINMYMCEMNFDNTNFVSSDSHYWIYTRCCMVRFVSGLTITCTEDFTSSWPFRFDESCVFSTGFSPVISIKSTSHWTNFVQIQRSFAVFPTVLQNAVAGSISGNFAGGNTSILKQTSSIDTY